MIRILPQVETVKINATLTRVKYGSILYLNELEIAKCERIGNSEKFEVHCNPQWDQDGGQYYTTHSICNSWKQANEFMIMNYNL